MLVIAIRCESPGRRSDLFDGINSKLLWAALEQTADIVEAYIRQIS